VWVAANLTKQNPNPTDYWSGRLEVAISTETPNITGMALVTN
jgi:hypothetical protein